ncbi:hypothetical protein DFS33DRAFT_648285 [Desarmillaria ectypa]|nr:hypothetical protein DFS33DRAFT_648285 [Desarmillaria ectypa]
MWVLVLSGLDHWARPSELVTPICIRLHSGIINHPFRLAIMQPSLPQELLDEIIDRIQDDILTLRACSLAARSFVPSSRKHLYSHVIIFQAGVDAPLPNSFAGSKFTCESFHNLLQEGICPVAPLVKFLSVQDGLEGTPGYLVHKEKVRLPVILDMLQNLERVSISSHRGSLSWDAPETPITSFLKTFRSPSLTSLDLDNLTFSRFEGIARILYECSDTVKHLSLNYITIFSRDIDVRGLTTKYDGRHLHLESLRLVEDDLGLLAKFVLHESSPLRIDCLRELSISSNRHNPIAGLLAATRNTLEHLDFFINHNASQILTCRCRPPSYELGLDRLYPTQSHDRDAHHRTSKPRCF